MAITRAQQAKQMLRKGGRIGLRNGPPGGGATSLGSGRDYSPTKSEQAATQQQESYERAAYDPGPSAPPSVNRPNVSYLRDTGAITKTAPKGVDYLFDDDDDSLRFDIAPPGEKGGAGDLSDDLSGTLTDLYTTGVPKTNLPFLKLTEGPRNYTLRKNIDFYRYDPRTAKARAKYGVTAQGYQEYMRARMAGEIDAAGNTIISGDDDDNNNIILPVDTTFAQTPSDVDQETDTTEEDEGLRLAFRANGGRIGAMDGGMMNPVGGIMDLETGRQMYFLGKLVKKATRAVKKIAKSPIGKAALLYAGTAGLGALGAGAARAGTGFGIFSPSNVLSNVGSSFLRFKGTPIGESIFGKAIGDTDMTRTGGLINFIKDNPFTAIAGASVVAGLLTPEQEEEAQRISDETGINIEEVRNAILQAAKENYAMDVRARGFKADGGLMRLGYQKGSKEPVAKKTMPLLDMGGKEMDLRDDGGFVPIGRMEKADDVPARLSKNEFVFTADAVRNAGDGDVDKGAEVMYNMMKNLESGGDVSEESQGLKGARRMFQTSQRLEEVL